MSRLGPHLVRSAGVAALGSFLAIGGSSVVAPMYIAEIAPAAMRGRLVALSQFNVVAGILAAYLSNYVIAAAWGGPESDAWRVMLHALVLGRVVSWTFPVIAEASGAMAFAFFAVMMALQFVLVSLFLPETKGVSLERIQRALGIE